MKKIYLALFIALGLLTTKALNAQSSFISIWDTEKPGANNLETVIPATGEYTYTWVKVELNGNSYDTITQGGYYGNGDNFNGNTVFFPIDGIYRVEISPDNMNGYPFNRIAFNNGGDKLRLLRIEQWGTSIAWSSFAGAFYGCENLVIASTDNPQLSNVTDMSYMFAGATALTNIGPAEGEYHAKANGIDNWDVGQVTNMEGMFSNAIQFNGDIGNWDVGQVTSMKSMFSGAAQFNADLSNWDVSKVTDMSYMFTGASSLTSIGPVEGEIHAKANGVDNWDVGQVTSMTDMFSGAISFNGDLGNWDVGQLTANGIGGSNDISFANSGMNCGNYSLTLQGWANQSNTPLNIVVDATGMNYSPDIIADRDILINDKNWTFKGDNEDSNCFLSIEEFNTSSFTIYPNPAQDQFTITGLSGNETIQLVDMTGRVLQTVKSQNQTTESIQVNYLANGVYNLVISTENGQRVTQKLIKQ